MNRKKRKTRSSLSLFLFSFISVNIFSSRELWHRFCWKTYCYFYEKIRTQEYSWRWNFHWPSNEKHLAFTILQTVISNNPHIQLHVPNLWMHINDKKPLRPLPHYENLVQQCNYERKEVEIKKNNFSNYVFIYLIYQHLWYIISI